MSLPSLTVGMPNYNHARFLPEALRSVLEQSYRPAEIIVIDDASTDDSVAVVEEFASRHREIRLIKNDKNMGVNYNCNKLLEYASGECFFGLACDDLALPGLFEKSIGLLAEYPRAGVCQFLHRMINEDGEDRGVGYLGRLPYPSQSKPYQPPEEVRAALESEGEYFLGFNAVYRRDALVEAGGFHPELYEMSDILAILAIALRRGICFVREPLVAWRRMDSSFSVRASRSVESRRDLLGNLGRILDQYGDLFPRNYRDFLEDGAYRYFVEVSRAGFDPAHRAFLDDVFELNPDETFLQKFFRLMVNLNYHAGRLLLSAYARSGHLRPREFRMRASALVHRWAEPRIGAGRRAGGA